MNELVIMRNLTKRFPGVLALNKARFDLLPGEVHALMGENGAGKSTLMKVLSGVYPKDSGQIIYKGQEIEISDPRSAQNLGISIIHQELNLMNHLTAAQNIFIGREPRGKSGIFLDEAMLNRQAKKLFELIHLDLDPRTKIGDLTVATQQMVEIAKALSFQSQVLIMDEPSAALNDREIDELFGIIGHLKSQGVGIVYISHKMDELKRISDRVTVMRDGEYIGTVPTAETSMETIISMMVGRKLFEHARVHKDTSKFETILEVKGLRRGRTIRGVDLVVRKGEILGMAGLMGAGRTEVARAIFGADPCDAGEIYIRGKRVEIGNPRDAVRHGIGYLSEDRKRYGLAVGMDVQSNIVLATMHRFFSAGFFIKDAAIKLASEKMVKSLAIKTPSLTQKTRFLSGGNQQKVVIAKWLVRDCDILFFDEPTRGIDVGAKNEIYRLLNELADQGKAIVMISSELPEILRMSHRIVVMCEGRITGELHSSEASQESIMHLATLRESMVASQSAALRPLQSTESR